MTNGTEGASVELDLDIIKAIKEVKLHGFGEVKITIKNHIIKAVTETKTHIQK